MMNKVQLIDLMIAKGVLRFGEFRLKSGRISPYFFNLGAIDDGLGFRQLGEVYAAAASRLEKDLPNPFDVIFGPAYKGIPLAVACSMALAGHGRNLGVAYNRKEAKGHGEGGQLVGAALSGHILLVDDVLTAGTAVREAVSLVRQAGGRVGGAIIALDRQERLESSLGSPRKAANAPTAVEALAVELNAPVCSLLSLADVMDYLDENRSAHKDAGLLAKMSDYQSRYCAV